MTFFRPILEGDRFVPGPPLSTEEVQNLGKVMCVTVTPEGIQVWFEKNGKVRWVFLEERRSK